MSFFIKPLTVDILSYPMLSGTIFRTVANPLGIKDDDLSNILKVGNNLSRDVTGANTLGFKSVFQSWSPQDPKVPSDQSEEPDYTIGKPLDLLLLLEKEISSSGII